MQRPAVCSCLALALTLAAPLASAQSHAATAPRELSLEDSLQGLAKDAFVSAKILFNNSDFEGAAAKYGQAFDLSKDPRLIFNLAICEKNLRHYARTQGLLQQYERDMGARMPADDKATVDAALGAIHNLVGTVRLIVTEAGASVSVDGRPAGTTPLESSLVLDLGEHTVAVKKSGFVGAEQTVKVAGGNEIALALTLAAESHTAQLLIAADAEAIVAIDGKTAARGRFDGAVTSGVHAVLVTEPGMVAYKADVELKDGETRSVIVTLESEKHGGALWPWIAGGAAVVAGAVVGGYFLFKTQPAAATPPGQLGSLTLAAWRGR
jgi:hypothetical protein